MWYSIGFDSKHDRSIWYGVPSICDHPKCNEEIDRWMAYCCGWYDTWYWCWQYFCGKHLSYRQPRWSDEMIELCPRCLAYKSPYKIKPDTEEWIRHQLKDKSWKEWRLKNPERCKKMRESLKK